MQVISACVIKNYFFIGINIFVNKKDGENKKFSVRIPFAIALFHLYCRKRLSL